MKLTVRSRSHPNFGHDNRSHFLLANVTLDATLSFEDGTSRRVAAAKTAPSAFVLDVEPQALPPRRGPDGQPVLEGGQPSPQLVTRIDLEYRVEVTLGGLRFTALRIEQRLAPTPRDERGRQRADYLLAAGGWRDALGRQRVANTATHPLADLKNLAQGELLLETLMLDITPGWRQLHRNNRLYQEHDVLTRNRGLTLKVFAHTAGAPFIWYAIVPHHLRGVRPVSAHVFLQPSDNREGQWPNNDEHYLLHNDRYFETDGTTLMLYLLPPVPDVLVPTLSASPVRSPERRRNVVNFRKAVHRGRETGEMTTDHWNIPAGMQKAFEHIGDGKPSQFLLLPQRVGQATSAQSESYGGAVTPHLAAVTNALFGLLESNIDLTLVGGDMLLSRGKTVLSGYSESGYDLWNASRPQRDQLKAVIGIEPQNVNSVQNDYRPKDPVGERIGTPPLLGKDVIPELLRRNVAVYIIGRHHLHYGPQIAQRDKLRLLPAKPREMFRYPPEPSVNDFVKYRVHRVVVPTDDPMLLPEERAILAELAARGLTGVALLPVIFGPKTNLDKSVQDGVSRWYSHHFALTGGDEMRLDPSGVYGKPVRYRTWFEVAVHEMG